MFILYFIFSFFVSADFVQNKSDILMLSGLDEKNIILQTEKSLEETLACSESGFSSGLEEFYIDHFTTPTESLKTTKFTVVTEVTGPSSVSCYATDTFVCYTLWINESNQWKVLGTDCDYDEVAED